MMWARKTYYKRKEKLPMKQPGASSTGTISRSTLAYGLEWLAVNEITLEPVRLAMPFKLWSFLLRNSYVSDDFLDYR